MHLCKWSTVWHHPHFCLLQIHKYDILFFTSYSTVWNICANLRATAKIAWCFNMKFTSALERSLCSWQLINISQCHTSQSYKVWQVFNGELICLERTYSTSFNRHEIHRFICLKLTRPRTTGDWSDDDLLKSLITLKSLTERRSRMSSEGSVFK